MNWLYVLVSILTGVLSAGVPDMFESEYARSARTSQAAAYAAASDPVAASAILIADVLAFRAVNPDPCDGTRNGFTWVGFVNAHQAALLC